MRIRQLAALVTALALVAAACGGGDRGDDTATTTSAVTDDTSTDSAPEGDASGPGDFGTLADVCGPNEGGGALADADAADLQGISADSIELGTVADPGFTGRLGLNQEIFDAATAFVEWCNVAGGINGKTLELNLHDAKITDYQPVVEQACQTDFALVGAGAVQDNLWPSVGAACGLIDIAGFSVSPEKAGESGRDSIAARSVQAIPNPLDRFPVGAAKLLDEEFPDAKATTGFVHADFQTIKVTTDRTIAGYEEIGHATVEVGVHALLGESNWQAFAVRLRDANVQFLSFIGEGDNLALLQRAMAEIDYAPQVTLQETNFYDQDYLAAAGDAAEGTYVRTVNWPFEEADENPATQKYLDIVNAIDGKVAILGVQSMSAWLLFATAAKACDQDDNLTRTCVLETAAAVEEWDGGGLHAPSSPATNDGPECVIVLQVVGDRFERFAPDSGYQCDPADIVPISVP